MNDEEQARLDNATADAHFPPVYPSYRDGGAGIGDEQLQSMLGLHAYTQAIAKPANELTKLDKFACAALTGLLAHSSGDCLGIGRSDAGRK